MHNVKEKDKSSTEEMSLFRGFECYPAFENGIQYGHSLSITLRHHSITDYECFADVYFRAIRARSFSFISFLFRHAILVRARTHCCVAKTCE